MSKKYKLSEENKSKFDEKRLETDEFNSLQIREIQAGLKAGLNVSLYADNRFLFLQMREIRKGLEKDINLSAFVKKGYDISILRQVRRAMGNGILIEKYVLEGYVSDQLEQIGKGIYAQVDISAYLNPALSGSQMKEIRLGLQAGIDISEYASEEYNWMQMKEIRLGLENEIPIFYYRDVNFSASQMKEIRLGLEENLNVCEYDSYQWSASDMRNKRISQKLQIQPEKSIRYRSVPEGEEFKETEAEGKIQVRIAEDEMHAYLLLYNPGENYTYTVASVLAKLRKQGIKKGISESRIEELLETKVFDEEVEIAWGREAKDGKDGYYDYFFCTEVSNAPCILEDGSVDYQNSKRFEMVVQNQKLAEYHPAEEGTHGYTVTGRIIEPRPGKELKMLWGASIDLLPDERTYIASAEGRIILSDYRITIYPTYTYNGDVTSSVGNIKFNGDIYVTGYVGSGVTIEAAGDVIIAGNVEAAMIKAGGDVLIRSGVNGADRGTIWAGNNISGKYFEKIYMFANNNIESNYILSCNCVAMGKIIVSGRKGAIVGGASYAIDGIEAYAVGNEAGARTSFDVGENSYFRKRAGELKNKKRGVQAQVEILKREIYKYQVMDENGELSNFGVYQDLKAALIEKQREMQEAADKETDFLESVNRRSVSLSVLGNAYPGCTVKINGAKLYLNRQVTRVVFTKKENRVAVYCTFTKKYIT